MWIATKLNDVARQLTRMYNLQLLIHDDSLQFINTIYFIYVYVHTYMLSNFRVKKIHSDINFHQQVISA